MAALAALMLIGRIGTAEPIAGAGYELGAIAAAVGGAGLMGGIGNGAVQNGRTWQLYSHLTRAQAYLML